MAECESCGTVQSVPSHIDDQIAYAYSKATESLECEDFYTAEEAYRDLAKNNPDDADYYWNILMCKYGVHHVIDKEASDEEVGIYEYKITVSRMSLEPVAEDEDYKKAISLAEGKQKIFFEKEVKKIQVIQNKFIEIAQKEKPYEVFISFKAKNDDGSYTESHKIAREIYNDLTSQGVRTFFSEKSLQKYAAEDYEPFIYQALTTAPVMLLIIDKKEQIDAPWVKNEWKRFLAMMHKDAGKKLIPVTNTKDWGMNPKDFPAELSNSQVSDLANLTARDVLYKRILSETNHVSGEKEVVKVVDDASTNELNIDNLIARAKEALQDEDYKEARRLAAKITDYDIDNSEGQFVFFLAKNEVSHIYYLMNSDKVWVDDLDYKMAHSHCAEEEVRLLDIIAGKLKEKIEKPVVVKEDPKLEASRREQMKNKQAVADANNEVLKELNDKDKKRNDYYRALDGIYNGRYDAAESIFDTMEDEYKDTAEWKMELARRKKLKKDYDAFNEEIKSPSDYFTERLKAEEPSKYNKLEILFKTYRQKQKSVGQVWASVVPLAIFALSIFGFVHYHLDYYEKTNAYVFCAVFGLIAGLFVFIKTKRNLIAYGISSVLFTAFGIAVDYLYLSGKIGFRLLPLMMLLSSILMFIISLKGTMDDLSYVSSGKKMEAYYNAEIEPLVNNYKQEIHDKWKNELPEEYIDELQEVHCPVY